MSRIETEVKGILEQAQIEGKVIKLSGMLDRAVYAKVDKVLQGLGGKWNRRLGGHVFEADPRPLVDQALGAGVYTSRQKTLQLYETDPVLASRCAILSRVGPGMTVLEPSAGRGRLVRPLLAQGAIVTAIEIDALNVAFLETLHGAITVVKADFLEWVAGHGARASRMFDAVVMNPPFSSDQDMLHIRAAWGCLREGGTMVAVCSEGAFNRTTGAAPGFQAWLKGIQADVEKLPAGSFKHCGTAVSTRLIVASR